MAVFRRGRDFAAWLGLVPRQHSSGALRASALADKMAWAIWALIAHDQDYRKPAAATCSPTASTQAGGRGVRRTTNHMGQMIESRVSQPEACQELGSSTPCSGTDPRIIMLVGGLFSAAPEGLTHDRGRSRQVVRFEELLLAPEGVSTHSRFGVLAQRLLTHRVCSRESRDLQAVRPCQG